MLDKDYSYLDDLAGEIYMYMYDKLIHKRPLIKRGEELASRISPLAQDEKKYLRDQVISMFDELRYNHSRKK